MNRKISFAVQPAIVQHPDYDNQIAALIRSNLAPAPLKERLMDYHEKDIAEAFGLLNSDERGRLCRILDAETLANVLEYADLWMQYLGELPIHKRVEVLAQLEPAAAAEYLKQLEKEERSTILDLLELDTRREILLISSFDEGEIGSKMTTNYISLHQGITVREAMKELVAQAAENDNIGTIYVIDQKDMLVGAIDLKDLIIAREDTDLDEIIMTSYPYVYAGEQTEDCIERLKEYSEDSIPVLDSENRLCGALTAQDVTWLVDEAMGEDYAKLAGLTAEEDLQEPLKESIRKRLPWLVVLLGLGLVVSGVVGLFEEVVASLTLVVCFQSLILDMAGNVGTQSLAITIRVLMDEQLTGRQKLGLVWKEARVGLVNGLLLGTLSFAAIGLYVMWMQGKSAMVAFSVSFCTGIALMVSMLLSSITGTVVPIIFKKCRIDPAVASGPLITTINDLVAVVTYYGLAWLLMIQLLHMG